MLDDRHYLRSEYREPVAVSWSLAIALLLVNVAWFLAELMIVGESAARQEFVNRVLALSLDGLRHGYVWQLVTYQFMHGGVLHLLFNCLVLYFVGRQVEAMLDRPTFLLVYFGGGAAGGVLEVFAGLIPGYGANGVVGASGSLMALLGAFCWLFWRQPMRMLVMFVLPVTLSGRAIFIGLIVIDVVGLMAREGNLAHFAHLGGLLSGFFYVRSGLRIRFDLTSAFRRLFRSSSASRTSGQSSKLQYELNRSRSEATSGAKDFMASEVDPILDKISAHGIHSLTAEERAILERAQKRMAKR